MKRTALILSLLLALEPLSAADGYLDAWRDFSKSDQGELLISWLEREAQAMLKVSEIQDEAAFPKLPPFLGSTGLFITLLDGRGRNRGCFGAFFHGSSSGEDVLRSYLLGALRSDIRVNPIASHELPDMRIVLTAAGMPFPVSELDAVDISSCGVLVTTESGRQLVFVPAEMKTHASLKSSCGKEAVLSVSAFEAVTVKKRPRLRL